MLEESYCKKCGKEFYPGPEHVYRDREGWYCCWTCFNHRNDDKIKKKKGTAAYRVERCDLEGNVIDIFKSSYEAAETLNCQPDGIKEACRVGKEYKGYLWRYKLN